jgi:hypothetical protein
MPNERSAAPRALPYRKPTQGRDFWLIDDVLPDPLAVRERALARDDWSLGYPHRPESWPGMRVIPGLSPEELALVETKVKQATGAKKLWVEAAPDGGHLNHNCVQVVGEEECGQKPHTDSRKLCKYAAVLYLNPDVPEDCGTSFFRQRMPGGQLGGNIVTGPHANLVEALGARFVPHNSFVEDVRLPYKFNRMLLYQGNLVHSATAYWGHELREKRMAAVFFWMAS